MNLIAHIIFHFFVQITRDGRTVKKAASREEQARVVSLQKWLPGPA